jgi:hypothetical protein
MPYKLKTIETGLKEIGEVYIVLDGELGRTIVIANTLEGMISYLNELEKSHKEWMKTTEELLYTSLTHGVDLIRAQEKIATMLRYPGLDGFIKEKFSKPVLERRKEEVLINNVVHKQESD